MKIYIDAMGGDNAPQAIVEGTLEALRKDGELEVVLGGPVCLPSPGYLCIPPGPGPGYRGIYPSASGPGGGNPALAGGIPGPLV